MKRNKTIGVIMFLLSLACSQTTSPKEIIEEDPIQNTYHPSDESNSENDDANDNESTSSETEDTSEELEDLGPYGECTEGIEHYQFCSYYPIVDNYNCNELALEEANLLLSLTCEDIEKGLLELPLCETAGLNCYQEPTCDSSLLTPKDYELLLTASDVTTLEDIEEVADRLFVIRNVFVDKNDIRGLFASVYHPITQKAIQAIQNGSFENTQWTESLVLAFARRYFENLHEHLLGGDPTESWSRYYDLHTDCSVSHLRQAASGIAVHLIIDLPYTLEEIESTEEQYDDYYYFGDLLIDATPQVVDNLRVDYNTESEDFFRGFFIGDWVDGAFGDGVTTNFMFQRIRDKAWNNGQWLQDWRHFLAEFEIYTSWRSADGILATLDAGGL